MARQGSPVNSPSKPNLAFAQLETALAVAGAKPADLVRLNYYVVGLKHEKLITLREARDRLICKDRPPPSTRAGVQALFCDDVHLEILRSATKRQRRVPQADFWADTALCVSTSGSPVIQE